jgi:transposase
VQEITEAPALIAQIRPQALLADKGYDADSFVSALEARGIQPVIPPRALRASRRSCDYTLYKERNLVERFFNTIKHFRGIATRYEKTARNFLAGLHLVCALAWLK